ncbi:MAG: glycosyltransferase [Cellulomonadaceae bacterium]
MHVVLIPAYEPDERLVQLVTALRTAHPDREVLVVDDGSGPRYAAVFAAAKHAGACLLRHPGNRGKGAALRTGFAEIAARRPGACVVTADADGQHTPADVERVAARVESLNPCLVGVAAGTGPCGPAQGERTVIVLGTREFAGQVPARSRIGNAVTRTVFRTVTGTAVHDTQTGLRGLPAAALPWLLTVRGDRFEYEFRMLLHARGAGIDLVEEPIATLYDDGNSSSHFRPVVDSIRIYAPLARFAISAFAAFLLDTAALMVLNAMTGNLVVSVIGARLVSGALNFLVNRTVVFRRGWDVPVRVAAWRYVSLAVLLLAANFGIITALTDAGLPLLLAKVVTETALFVTSYAVQRAVVFAPAERE